MKIISQSADELVLKEGSASGMVAGGALVIAGVLAWYFLHRSNSIAIWIALALVAAGLAAILFSSSITVVANKGSGQVSYRKKRLIGAQDSTYSIADIFRIETRKQWQVQNTQGGLPGYGPGTWFAGVQIARGGPGGQGGSMPQPVLVAQSVIVFKDGRELPLDHRKTSSSTTVGSVVLMGGQGAETAIAAQVANFLDVPFQEIAPPNMGMGINIIG